MQVRKKILHLITGVEFGGGAENMLLHLLPLIQQDSLDNRVCVIRGRGEIGKKLELMNITVYYLEVESFFDFGVLLRYKSILQEFKPDIQVNYLIHADIFGRIIGRFFGVPVIVSYIRNIHRRRVFWLLLDRMTIFLVDRLLANSEAARRYYVKNMGMKASMAGCIPNGVDLSRFRNVHGDGILLKKSLNIPLENNIIGTVARLEKQKDIPTLVRAFASVKKQIPRLTLLLVGSGKEELFIRALAEELKIKSDVIFLQKRNDIPALLSIMDIFVLPSLHEGMSNALLEAMSAKKIIIASDIEENAELISDKKEGILFSCGEASDLALKILDIINHPESYSYFPENAFKKIQDHYDIIRVSERYRIFLEEL